MRWFWLGAGAVAIVALAVQLFWSAAYGVLAAPGSLPHAIAGVWPLRFAHRTGLDRISPLRLPLVRAAIVNGDDAYARSLLAGLDGRTADDLRGRLALARGDSAGALRAFAAADDYVAARGALAALTTRDPLAALTVVRGFDERLAHGGAPEIEADIVWREGQIAAAAARAYPEHAAAYDREALDAYRRALVRAPNEETYLLNYGFQALKVGEATESVTTYRRAAQVVPDSVDAFTGLAVAAAVSGACSTAVEAIARARELAAEQHRTVDPAAMGYRPAARAAFARCVP